MANTRKSAKPKGAPKRGPGAKGSKASGKKPAAPARSLRWRIATWSLAAFVWLGIAGIGTLAYFAYDLPDVGKMAEMDRRPSVRVLAVDGTPLATYGDLFGDPLRVAELPPHLSHAVLAVEDRRFYEHPGIDPLGLLRAIVANIQAGRLVQGGSSITQQLAKNLFLTPERTFKRKVQEAMLAFWLESRFNKDDILSLYLNRVYFGAGTYGVDAASRRFFGKSARQVNLYEAAMLAGLLKAPSRYNPANSSERAHRRTTIVLASMADAGFITVTQAERAAEERKRGRAFGGIGGRHFADWVLGRATGYLGEIDGDLVVRTTIDPALQRIAEEEAAKMLAGAGRERGASEAAVLLLSPDGAIRAMVGGGSYDDSQFNRATQALRQPGSAFKAFVYLAALEQGMRPEDRILDAPITVDTPVGPWTPKNYTGEYHGEVTLREAFAGSYNTAAVRLSQDTGLERTTAAAARLGVTSPLKPLPAVALGAAEMSLLELTGAYAVFANSGYAVWPFAIEKITSPSGVIHYRREARGLSRVGEPQVQNAMLDLMTATVAWGTGKAAQVEGGARPAAGKTGTSQDFRDAWFIGFTAELVGGVWLGNDANTPMQKVTGGSLPAQLWSRIVTRALKDEPLRPLLRENLLAGRDGTPSARRVSDRSDGSGGGFIDRIIRSLRGDDAEKSDGTPGWDRGFPGDDR